MISERAPEIIKEEYYDEKMTDELIAAELLRDELDELSTTNQQEFENGKRQ